MGENGTILDTEDLAKIPGIDSDAIQIDNTPRFNNADDDDDEDDRKKTTNAI